MEGVDSDVVERLLISGAMLLMAVALAWFAWAAARDRLPLNGWAGIRLPSTMRSEAAWYAAHRAAAPWFAWAAAVSLVAVPAPFVGLTVSGAGWAVVAVCAIVLVLVVIAGLRGRSAALAVTVG